MQPPIRLDIYIILLLLRWHYSPMRTFASLIALSQSTLFSYLSFQLLILHFLISVWIKGNSIVY
jgi:hypothetical protein